MTFEETHRRKLAVDAIHDIVNAMRAIAAGRIQGAQRALKGARRYQDVILQAVAALSEEPLVPQDEGASPSSTLLVFTSEQPLCGAFNQRVLALAERRRRELVAAERVSLIVVGRRGVRHWQLQGVVPDQVEPAATSIIGLRDVVKHVARACAQRHAAGRLGTLRVIYNRYQSLSEQIPVEEVVFPPDARRLYSSAKTKVPRRFHRYLSEAELRSRLVAEHVFIDLYRLSAESFAGEQASRLVAMDGATRNSERMQEELRELEQHERQDEITREILELISARASLK